ncbi:unnamed protein product [Rhizophagus irregularis]|nr:unnamed protein product [Rhizophagus irregularis]
MSYNLDINKNESNNKIINKVFKELLQELYVVFLDIEDHNTLRLNEFIHNTLLEYDLDPKNVLETMKINSQPDFSYSSLIGIFYQYGIGCEPDEIKAFEIFSNAVKNNKKEIIKKFSFDQKNEPITFCDDNIKELNEIITQYFYSLFLYKDIILNKAKNYKLYVKNAENGDSISQYYLAAKKGDFQCQYLVAKWYHNDGIHDPKNEENWFYWNRKVAINGNIHAQFELAEYYLNSNSINKNEKKAFRWYMKLANDNEPRALYIVAKCYRDGVGTDKDLKEAIKWSVRYEESKVF